MVKLVASPRVREWLAPSRTSCLPVGTTTAPSQRLSPSMVTITTSSVASARASLTILLSVAAFTVILISDNASSLKPTVVRMLVSLTIASPETNDSGGVRANENRIPSSPGIEFMKSLYITRLPEPMLIIRPLTTCTVQPSGRTISAWKPLTSNPTFNMLTSTLPVLPPPITALGLVKVTTGLLGMAPPLALTVSLASANCCSLVPTVTKISFSFTSTLPVVKVEGATRLIVKIVPSSPGIGVVRSLY